MPRSIEQYDTCLIHFFFSVGKFVARMASIERSVNESENKVDFDRIQIYFLGTNAVHFTAGARRSTAMDILFNLINILSII